MGKSSAVARPAILTVGMLVFGSCEGERVRDSISRMSVQTLLKLTNHWSYLGHCGDSAVCFTFNQRMCQSVKRLEDFSASGFLVASLSRVSLKC